jgi:hypothetical protein
LLVGFALLTTVPLHEAVQHALEWQSPVMYGARALLEEGTEIAAMLLFVWVLRANSAAALRLWAGMFGFLAHRRRLILIGAGALWPFLTAATFVLPYPGGPADWLAALLLLLCALLAIRTAVANGGVDARSMSLILFYVSASAAANAVGLGWDPVLLGLAVSVRGVALALEVAAAAVLLAANGRRVNVLRVLLIGAVIAASAVVWPASQLLWCGLPPLFALWSFSVESKGATVKNMPSATAVAAAA